MENVHFTQRTFRTLLNCFARPGTVGQLEHRYSVAGLYTETVTVIFSLIDSEVSFQTVGEQIEINQQIRALSGGQIKPEHMADFVIVPHSATEQQQLDTISSAKIGDLVDPQKSATIIVEIDETTPAIPIELTGPGIEEAEVIKMNISKELLALRDSKNKEFPLGVDFIFIERSGHVIALPRTTKVKEVTNEWLM